MASREEQEYSTQAPAGYIGNFLQQGIFPYAQKFLNQQFQNYGEADSSPFTYSGQRVADFDPREQYAMDMSDQAIGSYKPYLGEQANLLREAGSMNRAGTRAGAQAYRRAEDTGMGSTRGFDPNMTQQFYNPFEEDVVQQTLTDAREGLAKGDMALRDQAVQGGAFGGARGRINQEELARQVGRGTAEAIGGIRQAGFTGARDAAMGSFEAQQGRQAGLAGLQAQMGQGYGQMGGNLGAGLAGYGQSFGGMGQSLQGLQGQDINRTMGMGGLGRGRQQSLMDLGYQNFVGQYNLPMQTLSNVGSLTAALGPMAGGYGYAGGAPTSNTNFNPASGNIPNIGGPQQGGGGPQRPPGGVYINRGGRGGGQGGGQGGPMTQGPGSMPITDQRMPQRPNDLWGGMGAPKGWTPQGGEQVQRQIAQDTGSDLSGRELQIAPPAPPQAQPQYGQGGGYRPAPPQAQRQYGRGGGSQGDDLPLRRMELNQSGGGGGPQEVAQIAQRAGGGPQRPQIDPYASREEVINNFSCPRPEEHIQLANNDWILAGDLKVGDEVVTSEKPEKVTRVDRLENRPRCEVLFEKGDSIVTSYSHPYFVEGKGFVKVDDLEEGDTVSGLVVKGKKPFSNGPVISLSVDKVETYMLRGGTKEAPVSVLSHNKRIAHAESSPPQSPYQGPGSAAHNAVLAGGRPMPTDELQTAAAYKGNWGGVTGRERGNKMAVQPKNRNFGPGSMGGPGPGRWTPQGGGQGGGARKANGGAIRNTGMASLLPSRRRM